MIISPPTRAIPNKLNRIGNKKPVKQIEEQLSLSIVLPCLNESETLLKVIVKSFHSLKANNLTGEVIVADNGSTDGSVEIALNAQARVVHVSKRGYGAALISGFKESRGRYVVMGDSDDSYALDNLSLFIDQLDSGFDLVVGNRFAGGIEKGAMPWLHKYLGNPVLTLIGKIFYKVPINDFHCGLRAFRRDSILDLNLKCPGMEFASEMIVKASFYDLKMTEVPTTLKKDGRSRRPHLNTWVDGWRHLVFLLAASPSDLFMYPALVLMTIGVGGIFSSFFTEPNFGSLTSIKWLLYYLGLGLIAIGTQFWIFGLLARIFGELHDVLPKKRKGNFIERNFKLGRGFFAGFFMIFSAVLLGLLPLLDPNLFSANFTNKEVNWRVVGLAVLDLSIGLQVLSSSFFAAILRM